VTAIIGLDLLLVVAVLVVAYRAVNADDLFTAIVVFIVFGLLMALVWVRLKAPDLALAEAAIGAGITGALLLDAAGQLEGEARGASVRRRAGWYLAAGLSVAFALVIGVASVTLRSRSPGLMPAILEALPESGVAHPVTAVLLNFRGYDTWLEVAVLLVAGLGVMALRQAGALEDASDRSQEALTVGVASVLVPVAIITGGYLLWRGTDAPGGAFQAGAVIAAAGVVLILSRNPMFAGLHGRSRTLRGALVVGFAVFLIAAVLGLTSGGSMLEYPRGGVGLAILLVEAAVAISIATALVLLFAGGRPLPVAGREGDG
jgi:multisubunit Na+/H+ antiporter MnhB subunit